MTDAAAFIVSLRTDVRSDANPESLLIAAEEGEEGEEFPLSVRLGLTHERFEELLAQLPADEADTLELLCRGCRQDDVARIFGITQAAVSYRARRGRERVRWLYEWGSKFTGDDLRRDLVAPVEEWHRRENAMDARLVHLWVEGAAVYWESSSQSVAADAVGTTQGAMRHRLHALALSDPCLLDELSPVFPDLPLATYRDGLRSIHGLVRGHPRGTWHRR